MWLLDLHNSSNIRRPKHSALVQAYEKVEGGAYGLAVNEEVGDAPVEDERTARPTAACRRHRSRRAMLRTSSGLCRLARDAGYDAWQGGVLHTCTRACALSGDEVHVPNLPTLPPTCMLPLSCILRPRARQRRCPPPYAARSLRAGCCPTPRCVRAQVRPRPVGGLPLRLHILS